MDYQSLVDWHASQAASNRKLEEKFLERAAKAGDLRPGGHTQRVNEGHARRHRKVWQFHQEAVECARGTTPASATSVDRNSVKYQVLLNELAIIIGCDDRRTAAQKAAAVLRWVERNAKPIFTAPHPVAAAPSDYIGKLRSALYAIAFTMNEDELRPTAYEAYKLAVPVAAAQAVPTKIHSAWESMCRKAVAVLNRHIVPDGISDFATLSELYGIFDSEEYRSTNTIEQDRCEQRQAEAMSMARIVDGIASPSPAAPKDAQGVVPEWFSVNNSLPEVETDVLVFGKRGDAICYSVAGIFTGDTHVPLGSLTGREWLAQNSEEELRFIVSHWMPLPSAPQPTDTNKGA